MSLRSAIKRAYDAVRDRSTIVKPERWQSVDVSKVEAATTHEVLNYTLQAQVSTEDLDQLRTDVEPNLPWADDHFAERVGGKPLNPGVEWAHWPWGNSASNFRHENVRVTELNPPVGEYDTITGRIKGFSHTYMERMWPKHADMPAPQYPPHSGIRYDYGDARDVVFHLRESPQSRQAFLPIWFPEDTGKLDVRVPCTLGYHFIQRHGFLHCTYYIRSCDLYRHFRDDVYLTVRLQLWMLERLRHYGRENAHDSHVEARDSFWQTVKPGLFTMHVVSLHCFVNDYQKLFRRAP